MAKARYVVQWDDQPMHLSKVLSCLVESQTLVDLTVNCNSYTIKVHKCVLAANSTYFRDHLQKDMSIDRVVINGVKHIVLKSLIEFMYCGETSIPEENVNELVAAAKFFCIRGITSIIPHRIDNEISEQGSECNLIHKPPLFFSKNDKKYSFKEKDSNFALFDNLGRRKHSHSKVTDEAHVALAKEEAASRFVLEMLKKDIKNTSNVFVIDETCTEATVETNLTAQYENANNVMQIQEYDTSELVNDQSNIDINNLLPKTKQSPNDDRISELTNVPMLYKPNEGGYVNVNVSNQILESLSNSHSITYHVMPEDGNVDFQQYMCNNFGQYSVQIEATQQEPSFEIVNNVQAETKKPLTFTQLVADTVSSDYDSSYTENSTTYDAMLTKTEGNVQYVSEGESSKLVTDEIFAPNYGDNYGTDLLEVRSKDVLIENVVTPKKKRGRPPKRKLIEKSNENDSNFVYEQKTCKTINDSVVFKPMNESAVFKPMNDSALFKPINDSAVIVENVEQPLDNTVAEFSYLAANDKENENPNENDQNINDVESNKILSGVSPDLSINCNSLSNENRRQTRSSLKFN